MSKKNILISEPKVKGIPPPTKEEICRVGIVLEEDNKTKMSLIFPPGDFEIEAGKDIKILSVKTKKTIEMKIAKDCIICSDPKAKWSLKSDSHIEITPLNANNKIAPKSGIIVRGIVAGRGFHWQKQVDLSFHGKLEYHIRNKKFIVVNEILMEDYLACVVTSEMSSKCPPEFIKAQATAARSWMRVFLKDKHRGLPYSICNDDCCQRYQGTTHLKEDIIKIVSESRGVFIVTEQGHVCASYYSKSCGGIMEKCENIFGKDAVGFSQSIDAPKNSITKKYNPVTQENIREWVMGEWLTGVDSFCSPNVCPEKELPKYLGAVDEAGKYFRWEVIYTNKELVKILKEKAKLDDIKEFIDSKVDFMGNSGRIHKLRIIYKDTQGKIKTLKVSSQYEIRYVLHKKFLFSSGFVWDYEKDKKGKITKIILRGAGWGHGAGFCQIGALGMSLKGYNYKKILKHYFGKTKLKKVY